MRAVITIATCLAGVLMTCSSVAQAQAAADADFKPLSDTAPAFPDECVGSPLEVDYVAVEYDITSDGTIDNLAIVESSSECFHQSAIEAATDFRFEPRRVGGVPVPVKGVRNKFTYALAPMREDVESELQSIEQRLFDGDGAGALQLLSRFEAERGTNLNRYEHATFLWMRGVAHSLEQNYPAARDDLRAALDTNDLYPETIDWIRSVLSKVEAKAGN